MTYTDQQIPENIDLLIRSFIKGTISKQGLNELSTWVHESEENRQYAESLAELLFSHSIATDNTHYDVEAAIGRFRSQIGLHVDAPHKKRMSKVFYAVVSAAAVFVGLLIVGAYWFGKSDIKSQFADIVVESPAGSQMTAILPDGSRVDLNADSRLTYSQGFGINDRTVKLEGEGLFHVKHQDDKPFTVKTDGMVVTDIGTTFMAHDYKEEQIATIDLVEGSVDVANVLANGSHCKMRPGQRVNVNKQTGEISRYRNEASILNTNINSLNFIDTSMGDIARHLSRSYGVKIEVSKDADTIKFNGFFNRREQSLQTILNSLTATGLVRCTFKDGKYTIHKAYAN